MENLNLVELNKDELRNTEGGLLYMLAGAYVGIAVYAIMDDPQGVWNGFVDALM